MDGSWKGRVMRHGRFGASQEQTQSRTPRNRPERKLFRQKRNRGKTRRLLLESLENRHLLAAVPQMLVDLNPGVASWVNELTDVDGVVFFHGYSGGGGTELWKTDGTTEGTVKVTTVTHANLTQYAYIGDLVNANGVLAFGVFDDRGNSDPSDDRVQLWKSDGTTAGTKLVWDFGPGGTVPMSHGAYLTAVGGGVFGVLRTGAGTASDTGYELFYSDLDETNSLGTHLVKDIRPGTGDSDPSGLLSFDGKLYFAADDGTHGKELWVSDGTEGNTVMVANVKGLPAPYPDFGSYPTGLTAGDGVFFFGVLDPGPDYDRDTIEDNHVELWESDGTTASLVHVFEDGTMPPGGLYGNPELTYVPGSPGKLFGVVEFDDAGVRSRDLVCWDGSNVDHWNLNAGGNDLVGDLFPVFGVLGFGADDGTHGREPWTSDGHFANSLGTYLIKDVNQSGSSLGWPGGWSEADTFAVADVAYFAADDGVHGQELWRSDGSESGTRLVADINPDGSAFPGYLTAALGKLFFVADDGEHSWDPWVLDPSAPDVDFGDAPDPSYPTLLARDGARHTTVFGLHLGASIDGEFDGQPSPNASGDGSDEDGVELLTPLVRGRPAQFRVTASKAGILNAWLDGNGDGDWDDPGEHFVADEALAAGENTLTRTVPLDAVATDSTFARFRFSSQAGLNYDGWAPDGEVEDYEVQIVDGLLELLADVEPGPSGWGSRDFTEAGDAVFFASGGLDLWKSDGTPGGTAKLLSVTHPNLSAYAYIGELVNANGILAFGIYDNMWDEANGRVQLWKSDGSVEGTVLVKDFGPGSTVPFSGSAYLTAVGGQVFGVLRTPGAGSELWASDLDPDNPSGTFLVKDINPSGDGLARRGELLEFGEKLYFAADDGVHGTELWVSDGTEDGTQMVKDIGGNPYENYGSDPTGFAAGDGEFFFGVLNPGPDYDPETEEDNRVELWKSDGSELGTVRVHQFEPGTTGPWGWWSDPEWTYIPASGRLFGVIEFDEGDDRSQDLVCWDGTTMHHWNLNMGGNDYAGSLFSAFGLLWFAASDGVHGRELWRASGGWQEPVELSMIKDIDPGDGWGLSPEEIGLAFFAAVGTDVYFPADDGVHGTELWRSDGSEQGTRLVADIFRGSSPSYSGGTEWPNSSYPYYLTGALGKLFFIAGDGIHGEEPWVFDPESDLDFGDAPDPSYRTLLANDGARHLIVDGFHLGNTVDAEADGQPDLHALGDDLDGNVDDDGVSYIGWPEFPGTSGNITVTVTDTAGTGGYLDAWMDFDRDGDWDDSGEQIFTNLPVVHGDNTFPLTLPANAVPGYAAARFRLSRAGNLSYGGFADSGEVEDYMKLIKKEGMDFGDAPDGPYPTFSGSVGAVHSLGSQYYLGAAVDHEYDGQPDPQALGDDNDGSDDEEDRKSVV